MVKALSSLVVEKDWALGEDWWIARGMRVNTLFIGPRDITAMVLAAIEPDLHRPIRAWRPGEPLPLTDPAPWHTLILHDLTALSRVEQHRLLRYLDRTPEIQVISTATASLLPQIEAREFVEALYYRLNIITIDVPRQF
jgi:hypothetical protein